MNHIKPVPIILLCMSLIACSGKVAYNYLDWIIEWYITDYVSLDDTQEWLLRDSLKKGLTWHKSSQLPLYVTSLEQLKGDIESQLTQQKLLSYVDTYQDFWHNIRSHLSPMAMSLLTTLTTEQIQQLVENLEAQNQEFEEEYVNKPNETLYKERSEQMIERLEHWIDDLTPAQQQTVQQWSRKLKPISKQWIANRRLWQQQFVKLLYEKRNVMDNGLNAAVDKSVDKGAGKETNTEQGTPLSKVAFTRQTDLDNEQIVNGQMVNSQTVTRQTTNEAINEANTSAIDAVNERLMALFLDYRQFWTEEYTGHFNENFNMTLDLLLSLEKQLSPQQRNHLLAELSDLSKQLKDIHQ